MVATYIELHEELNCHGFRSIDMHSGIYERVNEFGETESLYTDEHGNWCFDVNGESFDTGIFDHPPSPGGAAKFVGEIFEKIQERCGDYAF